MRKMIKSTVVVNNLRKIIRSSVVAGIVYIDGASAHGSGQYPMISLMDIQNNDVFSSQFSSDVAVEDLTNIVKPKRVN